MFEHFSKSLEGVIDHHKTLLPENHSMTEREAHYFIQGLEVAKQLFEQCKDDSVNEFAYETFEEVVREVADYLDRNDMEVIIEDIFMDKNDEDEEEDSE